MRAAGFDGSFRHRWQAEAPATRPYVLPARHFTFPLAAEEAEHGALEVLVKPESGAEFLATCVLGFADAGLPNGVWSCPNPDELCVLAGGYAYILDTTHPERFTMLPYRPVVRVHPLPEHDLLIFTGHHSLLAWGANGRAWMSERLSWEGVTIDRIAGDTLYGTGWDMIADKDVPFLLNLATGEKL